MEKLGKIPCRGVKIAWRIISGEAVIVLPSEGYVYAFNETGTRIWKAIDGRKSVEEIVKIIINEYKVEGKIAREDVIRFLKNLVRKKAVIWKKRERSIQNRE